MSNKKRAYVYVDTDKYAKFKKILDALGLTMTDFFDKTMDDFIETMEIAIKNNDKDVFIDAISIKLDKISSELSEELKK